MRANLLVALFATISVVLSGCAKVSGFREPYMMEVFTGGLTIIPAIEGAVSNPRPPGMIAITGDASGKKVTIFGLPAPIPFELISEKVYQGGVITPNVSGLEAEVIDDSTLKIIGFGSKPNDAAEELKVRVTGTLIRSGIRLATKQSDPIRIWVEAGALRKHIKSIALASISPSLDALTDSEMIPIFMILFVGEAMTVLA